MPEKTGALVALAAACRAAGDTVVFLSVDRFPGVAIAADLQSELRLDHPLVEVLAAAPGSARKLLFVDALDAARGGSAEGLFAKLIEEVGPTLGGEWTIVASIRTFDLKNGRRYREAIPGSPPDPAFADAALNKVRHFQVPRLTDVDLASAGAGSPELETLLAAAPENLRDLLRNVFNLSLAAQLLSDGATPLQHPYSRNPVGLDRRLRRSPARRNASPESCGCHCERDGPTASARRPQSRHRA